MARATWTKTSRKARKCGRCGRDIVPPEGYWQASPGFRRRTPLIRCKDHPFRASELTTSLRSEPLAAVEAFSDAASAGFDSMEDLETAWGELTDALQEYVDTRQEALDQWENGNSQLEELVDTAQNALDEAESHTFEDFDEDEPERDDFKDSAKGQDKFDAAHAEWDEAYHEHISAQADDALSVAEGLDL